MPTDSLTRTLIGPVAPPTPCVLVGGFDLRALGEIGVWRRLLTADFGSSVPIRVVLMVDGWPPDELAALNDSIPKSEREITFVVGDRCPEWRSVVDPDRPERSFAAICVNGVARPLMVGSPTEVAWEEFSAAVSLSFGAIR